MKQKKHSIFPERTEFRGHKLLVKEITVLVCFRLLS